MLLDGTLTVWRRAADGSWGRRLLSPARVEATEYQKAGAVGPLAQSGSQSDGIVAYLQGGADVRPGDRVAAGARDEAAPPDGACAVLTARALTLRGRAHHVEVRAQ